MIFLKCSEDFDLTVVIELQGVDDVSVGTVILVNGLHFKNRTSGFGRLRNFDGIRPGIELRRELVDSGHRSRGGQSDRGLGVLDGVFAGRDAAAAGCVGFGPDSGNADRDERARFLRDVTRVARDDDDLVNNVLPLEVQLLGEREEARLRVDVEVSVPIRLTPVDGVSHAAVLALVVVEQQKLSTIMKV